MKCSNVRKEIERWVYRDDPDIGADISRHLDTCKTCARYLEESGLVAGKIAGLKNLEPFLKNPEGLTEDIMLAISEVTKSDPIHASGKSGKSYVLNVMVRLLAAASVCLFIVFGYEEYILVDKISRLEKQNTIIAHSAQYHTALKFNKAISILASDPQTLNQVKEIKSRKMCLSTLFKAAIYYNFYGYSPDDLKLINNSTQTFIP